MKIQHKTVLLKEAAIDGNGRLTGYGAVYGNVDEGGDEIVPGAMAKAVPKFLKSGFIAWGHDWNTPVAMPMVAREDPKGLWIEADFHSTPGAQEKRTIAKERLDAGLEMGLSIGYGDVTAKRLSDRRQLTAIDRLYEVSLVMVPMNGEAGVSEAKDAKSAADNVSDAVWCLTTLNRLIEKESIDTAAGADDAADVDVLVQARDWVLAFIESESIEVGTDTDLEQIAAEAAAWAERYYGYGYMGRTIPLADHLQTVTTAAKAAVARVHAVSRLRKEGRVLSSANRTRLESLDSVMADAEAALAASRADIADLLASAQPEKSVSAREAAALEFQLTMARLNGVLI